MALIDTKCARCGRCVLKQSGAVNRARRIGAPIYCGRKCMGLARHKHKPKSVRIEEKRLYDTQRRVRLAPELKAQKAARHRRTYDPVKAARERKKRMPRHVEYCRRPEYKRWKSEYDRKYRALKCFGPFAEAYLALAELDKHISERITDYETRQENGTNCKKRQRRRQDYADTGRYRYKATDGQ